MHPDSQLTGIAVDAALYAVTRNGVSDVILRVITQIKQCPCTIPWHVAYTRGKIHC